MEENKLTWDIKIRKKRILLDQPRYLGDIVFVMAIAQKYANEGYVVDFPLEDEYYFQSLNEYFPNINFIRLSEFFDYKKYSGLRMIEDDEYIYLPLAESWQRVSYPHMRDKYECLGLKYDMWHDITIKRNFDKEKKIFEILQINADEKYNLINENHSKKFIKTNILVNNGAKNVYMKKIEGYSIFDWIGVMEKAQSIHTVGTSIIFLLDVVQTMPDDMHIYKRQGLNDHSPYNYLLNKKYIYH